MSIVLSQVLQVLSSIDIKTVIFLNMDSDLSLEKIATPNTQNQTTTQQTKKTDKAKNKIQTKTKKNNKEISLVFNNPILKFHKSNK